MRPSINFESNRTKIKETLHKFGLLNPRVFGSVLRGQDNENSDLDILVDAASSTTLNDLVNAEAELEKLLGCKVDVKTPEDFSKKFRNEVLNEAKPI